MTTEKRENKERELDSFLKGAQESRRRPEYDNWEGAPRKSGRPGMFALVLIAGLVVLLLVLFFAVKELKGLKGDGVDKIIGKGSGIMGSSDSLKLDQGKYQAVFLTNGQVYFGKVGTREGEYLELMDIFYLQVKPVLQQGDNNNENKNPQEQKTELSLVKLGNELHGPLDRMMINKEQIVFVEDLKDDSKVTEAIRRYQQGQK